MSERIVDDRLVVTVDSALEDLIPGFLARRREEVTSLIEQLDSGEMESVRITGHSLKGTGGGYGFDGLSAIGATIETAAKEDDRDTIRAAVEAYRDYLERVEVEFA